jgi:hypothetical protein
VFGDDVEGARNLAQKDYPECWSLRFVPVDRLVQIADGPGVELDSQALAGTQAPLDSSAHFRPVFELCSSATRVARAPIKLLQPCRSRIGVFGFIEALNEFCREVRTFASRQLQKLRKNFATTTHR